MSNILSIYNNPIAGGVYSDTPTQIGTWIDGTPVWRVAFDKNFTDDELPGDYITIYPSVKYSGGFVIAASVSLKYSDSPCYIDDYIVTLESATGGRPVSFKRPSTGDWHGYYGYIDFVTVESNVKFD